MPRLILLAALMISGAAFAHDGAPEGDAHRTDAPASASDRPAVWPIDPGANSIPGTGDYITPYPGRRTGQERARMSIPNSMGQGSVTPPMFAPGD